MKSYPASTRPVNSECVVIPVSMTATVTDASPVVVSHAAGASMPQVPNRSDWLAAYNGSLGTRSAVTRTSGATLSTPSTAAIE